MAFEIKYNNLNEVLEKNAKILPDKIFMKYLGESKKFILTYSEFNEKVIQLANVFISYGAKKGDFIGLHLSNSIEFGICIYACYRIGAVATPLISLWKNREIVEAVQKAKIELIILRAASTSIVKKVSRTEPIKNIILVGEEKFEGVDAIKGEFWELLNAASKEDPTIEVNSSDVASCHFTSGTTGKSKGVLHDHRGYLYAGIVHTKTFNLNPETYSNLVLPMYHIFGFAQLCSTVYNAATIRMLDKFDPKKLLKALEDPEMTLFCGVPSIYNMLMTENDVESYTISPKNQLFISGAGALSPKTEKCLNDRLLRGTGKVCQAYGSTEDTCVGTANYATPIVGAIGLPMKGANLEIVDDDGNILPMGKDNVGMIVNQSPSIMLGYLDDPKADDPIDHSTTDLVLKPIKNRDGLWYWSGDLGYRDGNGVFFLTDRSKDIAKVSERLVFPSEVESVLIKHNDVKAIAVIGVPHDTYGETLLAVVIPQNKEIDKDKLKDELISLGEANLAKYKVIREWKFDNALQTNSLGKVLKRIYREKYIKKMEKKKAKMVKL